MSEVSAENSKKQTSDEKTAGGNDEAMETESKNKAESTRVSANEDVQRAIEGLAEIADEELQEFLNDEDFMKGLDVVDAWRGDLEPETKPSRSQRRTRERERPRSSRERPRRDRRSSHNRDRLRREERRRDDARRDPSKSSKDIERDKMRTRKDTASKILAEKEKAIKKLLDSDDVVPPGTEVEAILDITEKQQTERSHRSRGRRSRERRRSPERGRSQERGRNSPRRRSNDRISPRRRSNDRIRISPARRNSDERRHARSSQERRRKMTTPPLRRSWERRASRDRSMQRRQEERDERMTARRSRSRDRHRSRSVERYRKRWSRSPREARRSSSRRRSRSRTRTPERRGRKRSPFINELARQFAADGLLGSSSGSGAYLSSIPPLMGPGYPPDQGSPLAPPPLMQQFMQGGPSAGMASSSSQQQQNFANFDQRMGPLLHAPPSDYSAGPIMYNQGNPPLMQQPMILPTMMSIHAPQPVPAPGPIDMPNMNFNSAHCTTNESQKQRGDLSPSSDRGKSPKSSRTSYKDRGTGNYNGPSQLARQDRLKTPEPPVISNSKPFEKTSLSSLLEASVSAKESLGVPILYPGFKPEILRQCEQALRDLPVEDLRFRNKGRFFYDPDKKEDAHVPTTTTSNSILLRSGQATINWDNIAKTATNDSRQPVQTRQKICQTDNPERQSCGVQCVVKAQTSDASVQVHPNEFQQTTKEEKRPIMDRLDWNIRETYDYPPKIREADDLRWSLSNSSQKRPSGGNWSRGLSPVRVIDEERPISPPSIPNLEHLPRNSNSRGRDNYSYDRSTSREHYSRDERFSPSYRRSLERRDNYDQDPPSDHSRGESPMALDDSPDEVEIIEDDRYARNNDWRTRTKTTYPPGSTLHKIRNLRGKPSTRPYRGRGSFRGKF